MQIWPKSILVDAGPLIALGRARDADHQRALRFAAEYTGTLITTLAVIAEVCHFVRERKIELFEQIRNRVVALKNIGVADMARLTEIYVKYPRADFADASLIVVAERTGITDIITLDDADFSVYRTKGGKHFTTCFDAAILLGIRTFEDRTAVERGKMRACEVSPTPHDNAG